MLDADVWGYSIPRMLGLGGQRPKVSGERKIVPLEAHGIKVMSIGFFIDEDAAVVWRGPMLHKALHAVPRGRRLGRARLPARRPAAGHRRRVDDARAAAAAGEVPDRHDAAAGRAEGRAPLGRDGRQGQPRDRAAWSRTCPASSRPAASASRSSARAAASALADELDVPLLGKVPLTMPLREQADAGMPLVDDRPDDPAAQAIRQAARGLVAMTPVELPIMQEPRPPSPAGEPPSRSGMSLPMAGLARRARRARRRQRTCRRSSRR